MTTATTDIPAVPATPAERDPSPVWRRAAVGVLLAGTAVLYLWRITINGMGNAFYAGAAQAGSTNWEALLFGSLDPHNFITVDKPPLSQWVMGFSGQMFGFSSASMLVPEALMAVAAVALLYAAVTRVSGPVPGLLAGAALAVTPVATLMFRFNNPDAVMVLLMTAAAYCTVRALDRNGARWLALAGVALGLAFLAKMLEGVMPVPALAASYLLAAPITVRKRIFHLLGAAAAMTASAGWFVLLTMWWPASSRPYLAGSTDNTFMDLVLGYNGVSRILGRNHAGLSAYDATSAAGGVSGDQAGEHGVQVQGAARLFSGEFGFEIGWLLPAALFAVVVVLVIRGRSPRTDPVRAATVLFGGWLLIDGLVLSYMHGTIHPYYSLSIAPAVAAMFAIGVHQTWVRREILWCRAALVVMLLGTGVWSWWVLGRNHTFLPGLRWAILALVTAAALVLLLVSAARRRPVSLALAGIAVAGGLAGSLAYSVVTVNNPHQGGGPLVGPPQTAHGSALWGRTKDNPDLDAMLSATNTEWSAAIDRSSNAAQLELSSHTAVMAIGGFSGVDPVPTLADFQADVAAHRVTYYVTMAAGGPSGPNSKRHADIGRWVAFNYRAQNVGDDMVYDLTEPPRTN